MTVHHLCTQNSILNRFVSELRDKFIQTDSMRFRKNLERVAEIMAYEISKTLPYAASEVHTPLGSADMMLPTRQPVIASILRAGLPMHNGLLNFFDAAPNAFISAYRKHHKDNSFEIALEYVSAPQIENEIVILCDPMIATGSSVQLAFKALLAKGRPAHTHIVCAIASSEGIAYLKSQLLGHSITIWCGAIDEELTAQAYIVPGLGDAGDLAFGEKH